MTAINGMKHAECKHNLEILDKRRTLVDIDISTYGVMGGRKFVLVTKDDGCFTRFINWIMSLFNLIINTQETEIDRVADATREHAETLEYKQYLAELEPAENKDDPLKNNDDEQLLKIRRLSEEISNKETEYKAAIANRERELQAEIDAAKIRVERADADKELAFEKLKLANQEHSNLAGAFDKKTQELARAQKANTELEQLQTKTSKKYRKYKRQYKELQRHKNMTVEAFLNQHGLKKKAEATA
ncbi:MAG: hypothetical protein KDK72_06830 [Chlamydiia bacterium]|nr:hypothetical protein [Chlamydiia bacterium]